MNRPGMNSSKAEAVAKIKCDYGVDSVVIRPMMGHWAIIHTGGQNQAQTIFIAKTQEECEEVIELARKEG